MRQRTVRLADFHRLPGTTPHIESVLDAGEIITAINIPASRAARHSCYVKVRDRASFEFAVVSCAAALDMDRDRIREARVAVGGVGTKPWRLPRVETALRGIRIRMDAQSLRRAAAVATQGAKGYGHNDFKIGLARRAIVRTLGQAARGTPQSLSDKKIR